MGQFKDLTNKGPGYDYGFINIIAISHIPLQNFIPYYVQMPFLHVTLLNLTKNVFARSHYTATLAMCCICGKTLKNYCQ